MLKENAESEIVKYVEENGDITSMSYGGMPIGVYYTYSYRPFYPEEGMPEVLKEIAFVGKSLGIEDMMGGSMGSAGGTGGAGGSMGGSGSEGGVDFDMSSLKTISARYLGGVDVANNISIYPVSFDDKNLVTSYLDAWNGDGDITVNGEVLSAEGRDNITYTDVLELVINMINTMIDIISYALIAFTSISLVVSTVMIGIITYISVVERIKEIGVIRSLGGRKRDVSNLFIAETFIIGLLAGLIGIGATYLISAIVNVILKPLIGYASIAALPIGNAIFLVCLSIGLTLISGLAPASSAAKKDPVVALRTE
jgi:putative ABC transport system permease protein